MSLILKSNKLATNSLGNINGIKGEQDWVAFFDFENGKYSKKINGIKTPLSESQVLSSTSNKNLATKPMTQTPLGEKSIITEPNQKRFWKENDRYGLLVEDSQVNWFANSSTPATQTILNIPATSTMVASCIGTGSITISGDGVDTVIVTENTPATIKPQAQASAINLTVTVSGSLSYAQVVRCAGFACVHTPIATTASKPASGSDFIEINQALLAELLNTTQPVTIVAQTVPLHLTADARAEYPELRIAIETDDLVAAFGLIKTPTGAIKQKVVSSLKSNSTYQANAAGTLQPYELNKPITQAIQVGDFGALIATNGDGILKQPQATGINKIKRIRLGSGLATPTVQQGANCIFTKLAIFNRLLTDAEILKISKSWL